MIEKKYDSREVAVLHFSAPPVIGGVEAVIYAHCGVFNAFDVSNTVIAGRGDVTALPENTQFIQIPMLDSRHPEVQKMQKDLDQGTVPETFEPFVDKLCQEMAAYVSGFEHVFVHNIFTKHFNLAFTAALYRLIDAGDIRHCIAWNHDFSWTSEGSRSSVHPGYPWDLLRTFHPDITHVTISEQRKKTLVDLLECRPEDVQVIYNGVDAQKLLGLSSEGFELIERLGLLDSDLNIIMPVRVTHAKNIEMALEIAAAIKKQGISFRMVLTGPPDPHVPESMQYFRTLQNKRDNLGLQKEMRFVYESGPEPNEPYEISFEVVSDLLRTSDVMLMTSHREGFGMPVLEAGLLGLAIYTTRIPASQEIARERIHQFDRQEDPGKVASQIIADMQSNQQFLFRRQVRKEYRWQAVYKDKIEPLLRRRE